MGGGDGGAGEIQAQNLRNQSLVNQGMGQLNHIFFGGTRGVNPVSSFKAGRTYYDSNGKVFNPSINDPSFQSWLTDYRKNNQVGMGAYKGPNLNPTARQGVYEGPTAQDQKGLLGIYGQQLAVGGNLFGGVQSSQGFNQDFYNKAQDAYLNFATPQLNRQLDQTNRSLQYKLGNQGIFGGSAAGDLQNKLGNELSTARIGLANNALGVSNTLRQNVNQQYNSLVGQLEASSNPGATTQQALQTASTFSQPSALPAVGQLFNNYANTYLASQNYNTYNGLGGFNQQQSTLPSARVVTTGR